VNDNWHRVKEIFVDVLRQKPADRSRFIEERCSGDMGLQADVESLLSSHNSSESFLESPAVGEVAEVLAAETSKLKDGDFLKHYRIIKQIGAGGMGEVYLASDTKLGRKVALKILSESFESGQSNLKRFFLEAKAASGLNHPNIMVVHEIGELDGTHYIACEYVEGKTLSEVIRSKSLSLVETVDISVQIISALDAAHKVGVIHRDIKADNLMLRDDGIVKVLDFGLVKMAEKREAEIDFDAATQELMNTRAGMILGTAAYMSPEQARGKPVDQRTDIWSFGVVLYQLLTKRLPFQGDTTSDIIASILKSPAPKLGEFISTVSEELEQIVNKTIQKDVNKRYQNADDLLQDLKSFRRRLDNHTKTEPLNYRVSDAPNDDAVTDGTLTQVTVDDAEYDSSAHRSFVSAAYTEIRAHPSYAVLALIATALLTVTAYFGFSKMGVAENQTSAFQSMKLAKLTYEGRATDGVAVSPDGKYIAYALLDEGKQSLMVRQVETDGVVELISPKNVDYNCIEFSPDGNKVFYSVDLYSGGHKLYSIPVLGGEPRKILDSLDYRFSISPDGEEIAFVRSKTSIALANIDGTNERVITEAPTGEYFSQIAWKPDASKIMVSVLKRDGNGHFLATISKDGGPLLSISPDFWRQIRGIKWSKDGEGIILAARDAETEFSQVWYVSYPDWQKRRITNDFSKYKDIGVTKDGETIVTVKNESSYDIWTQDTKEKAPPKKINIDERGDKGFSGVAYASEQIVYSVQKGYSINLWRINADGSGKKQLTFGKASSYFPVISLDEKRIVFISNQSGNTEIWSMDLNGEDQVKLTKTDDSEDFVSGSPDGNWYFYHRTDNKEHSTIWKMRSDGSEQTQLVTDYSERAVISNDGKYFACQYGVGTPDQPAKIAVFDIKGGKPLKLIDAPKVIRSRKYLWSEDDKSILYVDYIDRVGNIWAQPIDGGKPKQITFFESGRIQRFSVDRKSGRFVLSRGNSSADVVSIGNLK